MEVINIKSYFIKGSLWVAVGAVVVLTASYAIANAKWLYPGFILLFPLLVYIFFKIPFLFFFGLYASIIPLDSVLLITSGHSLTKYLAILIIIILFLKGISENKFMRPDRIVIWLILLSFYSILTILWAINPQLSLGNVRNVVALPIFYLIVSSYKVHLKDYEKLKWFIICGGFLTALMELYSYKTILQAKTDIDRVAIMLGDQASSLNTLAFSLLIPVAVVFGKILQAEKKRKLFLITILGFMLFSIILTGSRGGMLGVGVIFCVFFLYSKKKITLLVLIVAILILAIFFAPSFFFERWKIAYETGGDGRTYIWYVGLIALQKYFFIGAGLYNFPAAYNEFVEYSPIYMGINRASHNIYIGLFVELGIVGVILMLTSFVKHYKAIDKDSKFNRYDIDSIVLKASFWALLTSSFFLDTFWDKPFWLLWMLILIRKNALRKESARFYTIHNKSNAI
ncbi:MAG: O-antigen ligase family protein [Cytophagaceae bacterium]